MVATLNFEPGSLNSNEIQNFYSEDGRRQVCLIHFSGSVAEMMASVNCLSQSPTSEKFRITNYVVHTSELPARPISKINRGQMWRCGNENQAVPI